MKHIEDEEVKKEFDKAVFEFNNVKDSFITWREECEFFFKSGRESMPSGPKRTIKEIIKRDGEILGLSSDGKAYRFIWHSQEWYPLPDLPQD